jgi:hypothetical protein
MGSGGSAAGSGATPAGTFACTCGPQFIEGKPTGAQGRSRPEHRKRRARTVPSASGNRYREQRTVAGDRTGRQPGSRVRAHGKSCVRRRGGDMSTPQKCPPTRHYLQPTPDNRPIVRGGSVGWLAGRPRRTGMVDLCGTRAPMRFMMLATQAWAFGVSMGRWRMHRRVVHARRWLVREEVRAGFGERARLPLLADLDCAVRGSDPLLRVCMGPSRHW